MPKIQTVQASSRHQAFLVRIRGDTYEFPFALADEQPARDDPVVEVSVDAEVGGRGFSYRTASGKEDTILSEHVLSAHNHPDVVRKRVLYQLTLAAQKALKQSGQTKRGLARRLGTSAPQVDRLLDQTNYRKSVDGLVELLAALGVDIELRPVGVRTSV